MGVPLFPFEKYIIAHAIMMIIGFLFLLPMGALVARWMRTYSRFWFKLHWFIQFGLALPIIVTGFALGVTAVQKNDRVGANDTHKKWGIAIFVLYLFQVSLGGFIHFVKRPTLSIRHRRVQNYFHAIFGIFLIGIAFYQVRTGFRTEWPLYTGLKVRNGANITWIVWLVLIPTFYFSGLLLIPRQYKQERAAREARLGSGGSDAGSREPVQPKAEM